MKKFVTLLFLGLGLVSANAYATQHHMVLHAQPIEVAPRTVFVAPPKFVHPFTPLNNYDVLNYIDTIDQQFKWRGMPFQLTYTDPQTQQPATDTIVGVAQHFTSSFTRTYLDSVVFTAAVVQVSSTLTDNRLSVGVWGQQVSNGIPFPAFSQAPKDTAFTDDMANWTLQTPLSVSVPMHPKTNLGKNFFISVLMPYDITSDITTQSVPLIWGDSLDFSGTTVDPTVQRGYITGFHTTFVNILSQDQGVTNFYQNYDIAAYISDGLPNAVTDAQAPANQLEQNYPNPFNPSTQIDYTLAERSQTTLKVYNALGREVATLVNGMVDAGVHSVNFYGDNLPSGTYYYTLKAGDFTSTKRMVLAK